MQSRLLKTYWHRLNNDPNAQEKSQVVLLGVNEHAVRQAKKMYRSRNRTAWVCMRLKGTELGTEADRRHRNVSEDPCILYSIKVI